MDSLKNQTESEQMYLVSIARLAEVVDECPIPVAQVAELLGVTSISANQMIHHLEEVGLVTYTPYKGVEFTEKGWQSATNILKNRRLWEVFLVEKLHYDPQEVETMACRLEHSISDETAQRLAEFLGWPKVSPQGKPIPQRISNDIFHPGMLLSNLSAGISGTVNSILTGKAEKAFLSQSGIRIRAQVKILASQENEGCLIQCGDDNPIALNADLSQQILIDPENT